MMICTRCGDVRDESYHGWAYSLGLADAGRIGGQGVCGDHHDFRCARCQGTGLVRDGSGDWCQGCDAAHPDCHHSNMTDCPDCGRQSVEADEPVYAHPGPCEFCGELYCQD